MTTIDEQLRPGERLVWAGKANSDRLLRRSDYASVWVGVLLGTVGMAALIGAILAAFDSEAVGAVVGFGLALTLGGLGLYLVFGRFAQRYSAIRAKVYGITSARAIVVETPKELGDRPVLTQVDITPDLGSRLISHYENRGTIQIGDLTFENIDDAPVVFELLQAQIARARRAQG